MIALLEEIKISAESRFFIQAFLSWNDDDYSAFRVKDVAKDLHLTERLVRGAVGDLVHAGLLKEERIEGRTGRPSIGYVCTAYLRRLLYEEQPDFIHLEMMNRLFVEPDIYAVSAVDGLGSTVVQEVKPRAALRGDGRPAAPGPKGRLSAASRILLVALLSEADECGVVTGLGEKRLREITGLDSLQLKQQFKRLLNLGFIRSYVPGVSNGIFNGSKVKSIYYLNLTHPQICPSHSKNGLVMCVVQADLRHVWLSQMLSGNVAEKKYGPRVRGMLYHLLARHASVLLTALWQGQKDEYELVREAMRQEGVGSLLTLTKRNLPLVVADLRDEFCWVAEECAQRLYKMLLRESVWPGYTPNRVGIIPAPINEENGLCWTFLSLVVEPKPKELETCIAIWDTGKLHSHRYKREDEMGPKLRYDAALLTRPS